MNVNGNEIESALIRGDRVIEKIKNSDLELSQGSKKQLIRDVSTAQFFFRIRHRSPVSLIHVLLLSAVCLSGILTLPPLVATLFAVVLIVLPCFYIRVWKEAKTYSEKLEKTEQTVGMKAS